MNAPAACAGRAGDATARARSIADASDDSGAGRVAEPASVHSFPNSAALRPRSAAGLWIAGVLMLLGVALLTSLGVWQLERRVWKLALIERVEQRVHAVPVVAPGPAEWPSLDAASAEYRRVTVSGHFLHDRETPVRALTRMGAGFWIMTPLRTDQGFTVLVNRGFVPPERRLPADRPADAIEARTTVTGLLRVTEPGGAFLRKNEPAAERWYSRDVAAISRARQVAHAAPYFIDAEAAPAAAGAPVGGLTVVAFRNTHLVYALTWFTLALMLATLAGRIALREINIRRGQPHAAPCTHAGARTAHQRH